MSNIAAPDAEKIGKWQAEINTHLSFPDRTLCNCQIDQKAQDTRSVVKAPSIFLLFITDMNRTFCVYT